MQPAPRWPLRITLHETIRLLSTATHRRSCPAPAQPKARTSRRSLPKTLAARPRPGHPQPSAGRLRSRPRVPYRRSPPLLRTGDARLAAIMGRYAFDAWTPSFHFSGPVCPARFSPSQFPGRSDPGGTIPRSSRPHHHRFRPDVAAPGEPTQLVPRGAPTRIFHANYGGCRGGSRLGALTWRAPQRSWPLLPSTERDRRGPHPFCELVRAENSQRSFDRGRLRRASSASSAVRIAMPPASASPPGAQISGVVARAGGWAPPGCRHRRARSRIRSTQAPN